MSEMPSVKSIEESTSDNVALIRAYREAYEIATRTANEALNKIRLQQDEIATKEETIQRMKSSHTHNRAVRNTIKERDAYISHYRALAISGHPEMTEEQIDDFEWFGEAEA